MTARETFEAKYIAPLNEQQRAAARTVDGPVLLLAVPGSGKTTILVTRLGYMVYCYGIAPENILTMTYTVAATGDMKRRFASLFGSEYADRLEFRTINGVSSKIIRYYSEYYRRQAFRLLDNDAELTELVRNIYQSVNEEYAEIGTVKDIRSAITFIKNMMLTDEEIDSMETGIENLPEIYRRYQEELVRRRAMDFDDQMCYAKRILETCPPVLEYFQERCRYICVDEAQDTSKIQHAIIRLLARRYGNLFLVGDEDQSVYGFRAAWPDALMNFERDYPGARVLFMERNYRSTNEIIGVANAFISGNRFRRRKTILPVRGSGLPVEMIDAVSRQSQFEYLLRAACQGGEETAVLYRNNDSAIPFIDLLERNGVPYNLKKTEDLFFTNRVVRDMANIVRFAYDPYDEQAFMNIYYKFGLPISKQAAQNACRQSRESGKSILEELASGANGSARSGLQSVLQALSVIPNDNTADALERIWTVLRYRQYAKKSKLDVKKYEILAMLAGRETDAAGLLRRLDELRTLIQNHRNSPENRLILSTIHSSKGLEYDRVYLLDAFDGILPSISRDDIKTAADARLYEEERRLCYVAMTRAKRALYLFSCDRESAFMKEIRIFLLKTTTDADRIAFLRGENLCGKTCPDNGGGKLRITAQCGENILVEREDGSCQLMGIVELLQQRGGVIRWDDPAAEAGMSSTDAVSGRSKEPPLTASELFCGMKVAHKSFGKGKIVGFDRQILEIQFPERNETKRFMLDFTLKNRLISLSV